MHKVLILKLFITIANAFARLMQDRNVWIKIQEVSTLKLVITVYNLLA